MNTVDMRTVTLASAQISVMPLHAVTEVYGEAGLGQRLTLELERLPECDRAIVRRAAVWAADLHNGQRRTREPYVNHLLRVTLRMMCYYRIVDPEVLAAALLHDAVEDQADAIVGRSGDRPEPRGEALQVVAERFGGRVAALVDAVTQPELPPGMDRTAHYVRHVATSLDPSPWARVIKLSDFTDNGVGIIHTAGPKAHRSAVKYAAAVPIFRDLLQRADTPLDADVKAHINRQLDRADQRFAAILGT
ncbi:HD domain-containing protein [Actinoplanes auranticolor]|uniref:HD domain-containing protein n=1 Tax=Actinoplanes auranticolor TaxID=47988 RepID=UPI001FE92BA4|nr:HD domain-containing protein [Actinoplanes auranticolor]